MGQQTNRMIEVDYVKGMGILFMLIGHIQFTQSINTYIYSFHMPLFFVMSGYLYKDNIHNFISYAKKQVVCLIIPYLFFGFAFTATFVIFGHELDLKKIITSFIIPNHFPFDWCGAIWFLFAMFWVKIIYDLLNKSLRPVLFITVSIIIAFTGVIIASIGIKLPLCIDSALIGYFFYWCGHSYKTNRGRIRIVTEHIPKMIVLIVLAVGSLSCYFNSQINMRENIYGIFIVFLISAIAGTAFWISVFIYTKGYLPGIVSNILRTLNEYSISYMGINQFLIAIFNVFILSRISNPIAIVIAKIFELIIIITVIAAISIIIDKTKLRVLIGKKA